MYVCLYVVNPKFCIRHLGSGGSMILFVYSACMNMCIYIYIIYIYIYVHILYISLAVSPWWSQSKHFNASEKQYQRFKYNCIQIMENLVNHHCYISQWATMDNTNYITVALVFISILVGDLEHFLFSISYMGCHHPNWRSPSFFRGVWLNHQPVDG